MWLADFREGSKPEVAAGHDEVRCTAKPEIGSRIYEVHALDDRCRTAGAPRQLLAPPPHGFGEVRVAMLALLTLTALSG